MHCKNCGKQMIPTLPCQGCGWRVGNEVVPAREDLHPGALAAIHPMNALVTPKPEKPPEPSSLGDKIKEILGV